MPQYAREELDKLTTEHFGIEPEKLVDDATLYEDLGADSLDKIEMAMYAEEAFDCTIPDNDVDSWKTYGEFVKSVEKASQ